MPSCPCGRALPLESCCGALLRGDQIAPTAEALMRSRYTAYALQDIDYILATHDPATLGDLDRASVAAWAEGADWQRLDVKSTERGQSGDEEGFVEFAAHYVEDGIPRTLEERSHFRRVEGRWYYSDAAPARPPTPKAGRNEPCPCGSGKKYKKCCGARA